MNFISYLVAILPGIVVWRFGAGRLQPFEWVGFLQTRLVQIYSVIRLDIFIISLHHHFHFL